MNPARIAQTTLEIKDGNYLFRTTGSRVVFDGFSRVYPTKFSEITLPQLKEGQKLEYNTLGITEHETMPPPRYNEASLISTLEKEGIGRPSTYAPIISVIQQRNYIEKEEGKFKPTELGVAVNDFLVKYFSDIIDLPFTAGMEDDLDEIAQGKENWEEVLGKFWKPFIEKVDKTKEEGERVKIEEEKLNEKCPECKEGDLIIRIGRFGKFVACSKFPECKYTRPFSQEAGFDCPDCGKPTVVRRTKKGRTFYGCSGWPKCKWAAWKKPKS
jgi:DNA topoisomerase-1